MPIKNSIYNTSDEDFAKYVKESKTYRDVYDACGMSRGGSNSTVKKRIKKLNLDISHFTYCKPFFPEKKKLKDVCIQNSTYHAGSLKKRLFSELNWKKKCSGCGIGDTWNNKPITLELDHINGNNSDHRLENLRLLCPNCHSQTKTFRGRNVQVEKKRCIDCNKEIYRRATRCNPCAGKKKAEHRIKARPSYEQLQKDLEDLKYYTKIAKKYNVSDKTIKKWINIYEKK